MVGSLYYSSREIPERCENSFVDYRINYQKLCYLMRQITKELNLANVSVTMGTDYTDAQLTLRNHNWVHFAHRSQFTVEFKLRYLKNLKLFSIRLKKQKNLFEPIVLR